MQSKKIAVLFHAGSFGNYLGWLLSTQFFGYDVVSPFGEPGTSHSQLPHKKMIDMFGDFSDYQSGVALLHPKQEGAKNIRANISKAQSFFDKLVFLYPSKSLYLASVNNYVYKAKPPNKDIFETTLSYINLDNLYDNYQVAHGTLLADVPRWILRELLSFNLFNSWEDLVEWYFPEKYQPKADKMMFVSVEDLLYNTNKMLDDISRFLDLPLLRSFNEVVELHNKNLADQKYMLQDKIAKDVLESFYNNTDLEFDPAMTLVTEAYIQKHLRDNGYELLCDGLDNFPLTTKALQSKVKKIE